MSRDPLPGRRGDSARPRWVTAGTCIAVFLASASWFIPLMLVVMALVVGAGIYVRRWWFPVAVAVPLGFFIPAMYYSIAHSIGSEPGLALMMSGAANVFYVLLAILGCLIGWIVAAARRPAAAAGLG